ncbi:nucleoside deaminase [Ottowia sp.]|uniref:nucleoside deaminase n=1 Tax=Ottowia sp. TaxID=1898956 RepID=UPI002BEA2C81|nr:nucleoside deaminase [Ottowia sp.]HRN76176.1 nucleoside deaminase [Ottowia sp.]HRQ03549.1 nucleoside deaminase [Ottowia sp.]
MNTQESDLHPMQLAIEASREAAAAGDMPYGATLVSPAGEVLLTERNRECSSGDVSAHAEVVLVRRAREQLGADAVKGATVYASGEPCAMCAGAMFWAGVGRVVYAASQPEMAALSEGGAQLPARCADLLGAAQPPVAVTGGVLAESAMAVLREVAAAGKPG